MRTRFTQLRSICLVLWSTELWTKTRSKYSLPLPSVQSEYLIRSLAALLIDLCRIPSIFIIELYVDVDDVCVRKLLEVSGASHIRLFSRPYIGFAVSNGDDTSPSILNWETGCTRTFITPNPTQDLCINVVFPFCLEHVSLPVESFNMVYEIN